MAATTVAATIGGAATTAEIGVTIETRATIVTVAAGTTSSGATAHRAAAAALRLDYDYSPSEHADTWSQPPSPPPDPARRANSARLAAAVRAVGQHMRSPAP